MMNESDNNMTEQPLAEPAVQPEAAAPEVSLAETANEMSPETASPELSSPPDDEVPTLYNNVPLPMVKPLPADRQQQWSSYDYEMISSGLRNSPLPTEEKAALSPESPLNPVLTEPHTEASPSEANKKDEARRVAMDAYWKTALTGDAASIPDSFRARVAADDLTSSAEDSEYDLLSAVNRSWYADYSNLSREKILADWPRIREELTDKYGVENNERDLFTALSIAPEEEARQEAANKAYNSAFRQALLDEEVPKRAPWDEDANPWKALEAQARETGAELREELLPDARTLASFFRVYHSLEKAMPWESYAEMCDAPDMVRLFGKMAEMEPERRQSLYDLTLSEMKKHGRMEEETENLFMSFRRAAHRGISNFNAGLVQFAGNLAAAAGNLLTQAGGPKEGAEFAHATDAYMRLLEELRSVAQDRVNPIHHPDESTARMLTLDVAEATPTAIIAMAGTPGMVLASASGVGSNLAEVRARTTNGDISLQTGAGLLAFGVQIGISELFSRCGGRVFESTISRFVRERLAGATGTFSMKALGAGGKLSKEVLRNYADNHAGRGVDLLMQEGAAQLEGVASNIDWKEYGSDWLNVELNIREAARTLPYLLIGAGRASLSQFRDPHALIADGAALTQWDVPEETQRRLYNEPDVRKQNRILYDALHHGKRWGGVGFLEDAMRSLHLLQTEKCAPFRNKDVVRDFLQLPAESEAEFARALTLGDPNDPVYVQQLKEKHAGGAELTNPEKAMPFLQLTEEWSQRAYPEDLQDYPALKKLAPPALTRNVNFNPESERNRAKAVDKTVRYLDALTYRILLNSSSFSTLALSGKSPAEVRTETEAMRHQLMGKVAEAVVARSRGATPKEVSQIYGQFITDYHVKLRDSASADAWLRFVPPPYMKDIHIRALSERAMKRGPKMRQTAHPELLRTYWMVQGIHNCVESLVALMGSQTDFRTALSRGMTPQEAYAHLVQREFGERLTGANWQPDITGKNVTNRAAYQTKNREMVDLYCGMTGNFPESRTGDDGKTYWRIRKPDSHYTRWHDSLENCVNDVAADCRMRFLPLEAEMSKVLGSGYDKKGRYDAARVGENTSHVYSYYDRLSARATGDMIRFLQEDATQAIPGASVETYRFRTSPYIEDTTYPRLRQHPEFPDAWQIDDRAVRTPLGLLRGRFDAYWRNMLTSGWLSDADATDFLQRRGVIDAERRRTIEKVGQHIINKKRGEVTPALFFSNQYHNLPKPYPNTAGMRALLARHLSDYTMGYYLAHFNEQVMPESAREWFGLTPFRIGRQLYKDEDHRLQTGHNGVEQTEIWAHQRAAEVMASVYAHAENVRKSEKSREPLQEDPLYPLLQQAIRPTAGRSAEQGWAYTLNGGNAMLRVRPESWNLLQEPVRGWSLLPETVRESLHHALKPGETLPEGAEVPMPKALEELDSVLKLYPELHRYALFPGDASRVVQMDIPSKVGVGYRRSDTMYDHPHHDGDKVFHGGFRLQEAKELPEFFRTDERVLPALHTLSALRRTVQEAPYADGQGVWWNGELYGGKNGRKLNGMDDSWYAVEPMEHIRRIFREMPEDGSSVMDFGKDISFKRRAELPEEAFLSTTVYRSPQYPLSQIRLMPGEREAVFPYMRSPYVTHSFVGAPMDQGQLIRNTGEHSFFITPLESFKGDVTREMIGHMAGWWAKQSVKNALEMLMDRTASPTDLGKSHYIELSNRELLMLLTEDTRFSASLEGRSPHELSAEEALAATWFHTFAEYETGVNPKEAAKELINLHSYFEKHPERLQSVEDMLNDHRAWYELDPNDKWYHVITATPEIRRANKLRREREEEQWKAHMRNWLKIEEEWNRADLNARIGKPKTRREE